VESSEINPKIARALLLEEISVTVEGRGRKIAWEVAFGPFPAASGSNKSRSKAWDDIAICIERTEDWLKKMAASNGS